MEPFQVKMPCGSMERTQTTLPLASPQVVQTRKHSVEVRIAEARTPYKFPLILAPARLTAVSALQGQGEHSSHRGQTSCCLPSEHPHEKGPLRGRDGFPPPYPHHSWDAETLQPLSPRNSTSKWSLSITRVFTSFSSF